MKKVNLKKNLAAFLCAVGIVTAGGILGCSGGTNYTGTSSSSSSSSSSGTGSFEKLTADRIATTASSSAGTITLSQSTSSDMILLDTTIGTYTSLQAALDAAAAGTGSFTITLTPGTYNATGLKYRSNNNLKIKGDSNTAYGTDVLIVGQGSDMAAESTRSLLSFEGTANIVLENLTLKNSYGMTEGTAQAETLGVSNNSFRGFLTCYNCSFLSGQDTICTEGKAWFYKCYIEGDVDFLWMETYDGKVALYEECVIRAIGTRTTSAYLTAPRLSKNNSVWKGVVLYNSTLQAESGLKDFYLGRNPWAGSTAYYENVAIVGCKLYLGDGVTLATDVWKSAANGTSNQQYIGFKTDSYFPASSAGHGAILTADQIASEYAGRENILNRYYDTNSSKFKKDTESYWNVARTVSDNGLSVTADSSKSLLAGETEVKTITYTLSEGTSGVNVTSSTGDVSGLVLSSGFSWHGAQHGATASNGTLTLTLTEPSVITLKACQYNNCTIATEGVTAKQFKGASDGESQSILYTGTGGTLTLTFTGTVYLHDKITVTTLTDEANGIKSLSLSDTAVTEGQNTTLTATVVTKYLNDYSYTTTWTSSANAIATVSGSGTNCTVSGIAVGSSEITVTAGDKTATCTVTVNSADAQPESATYTLTGNVGTPYTSTDGFLNVNADSDNGSHGLVMKKDSYFTIKVLAGAVIKLGNCQYNNAQTVTVTNSAGTVLGTLSINSDGSNTCTNTTDFTYTGSSTDTLTFTWTGASGQNYLHKVQVEE